MSVWSRERRKRKREFDSAWAHSARTVQPEGWAWWNVHPLADESDVLDELSMTPADCTEVDVWWKTHRDVYLVHLETIQRERHHRFFTRGPRVQLSINWHTEGNPIQTQDVERFLREIYRHGIPRRW